MDVLRDLYEEMILDHNRHPCNFGRRPAHIDREAHGFNPLCGDEIMLYLEVENDIIKDVSFDGHGCAISTASASMMTDALKGKTVAQANELFSRMQRLLTDDAAQVEGLGKLGILQGVRAYPMRVKCATLAWHTLRAALQQTSAPITTE